MGSIAHQKRKLIQEQGEVCSWGSAKGRSKFSVSGETTVVTVGTYVNVDSQSKCLSG